MGNSAEAILFFGFFVGNSEDEETGIDFERVSEWGEENYFDNEDLELITSCTYDYPVYGIAVKKSVIRAYWGDDKCISPYSMLNPEYYSPHIKEQLDKFFKDVGMNPPTEPPCWHLVSIWG